MTEAYVVTFKWGTSKGAKSYGYTICNCFVDREKLGSTCGGGYDLRGTAFGNAMAEKFHVELLTLADQANSKYTVRTIQPTGRKRKAERKYDRIDTQDRGLSGLTAYFDDQGKTLRVSLDGACGFDCIKRIMEAIGFTLEYVTEDVYKLVKPALVVAGSIGYD